MITFLVSVGFKKIAKLKRKKIASVRTPTIFDILRNEKDPRNVMEKAGVYKIPVEDSSTRQQMSYIGVTTRTLKQRVHEHKNNIAKGNVSTALANGAYSKDLKIDWEESSIIRTFRKRKHAYVAEDLKIELGHRKEKLLNEKANELPVAWQYAVQNMKNL